MRVGNVRGDERSYICSFSLENTKMFWQCVADGLHVGVVLEEAAVVVAVLAAVEFALEIVIARSAVLVAAGLAAMGDHLVDPPLFRTGATSISA